MNDSPQALPVFACREVAEVEHCVGETCLTCSDAAVPGLVIALLDDDLAIVGTGAGQTEISVALVTASVGDTVLVHAGEAIAVIDE